MKMGKKFNSHLEKSLFLITIYLFVAPSLSCSTWHLLLKHVGSSSRTKDWTQVLCTGSMNLSHWTTRKSLLLTEVLKPEKQRKAFQFISIIVIHICSNMDGPRDCLLSELSQKKTSIIWYSLYGESKNKWYKWTYLQSRLTDLREWEGWEKGQLGSLGSTCTHCYI